MPWLNRLLLLLQRWDGGRHGIGPRRTSGLATAIGQGGRLKIVATCCLNVSFQYSGTSLPERLLTPIERLSSLSTLRELVPVLRNLTPRTFVFS
jgi:hypothetical protein